MGVVGRICCLLVVSMLSSVNGQWNFTATIPTRRDPDNCRPNEFRDPYENECVELNCPEFLVATRTVCMLSDNSTVSGLVFSVKLDTQTFLAEPGRHVLEYTTLADYMRDWIVAEMESVASLSVYCGSQLYLPSHEAVASTVADDLLLKVFLRLEPVEWQSVYRVWHLMRRIVAYQAIGAIKAEVVHAEINLIGIEHVYGQLAYDDLGDCNVSSYDTVDILCPYVKLSVFDYKYAMDDGIVTSSNAYYGYNRATSSLSKLVCVEHYLQVWWRGDVQSTADFVFVIVSVVCTSLSMVCLIFTVTTYTIFKDLRRPTPGKILLVLSVCLLVAQMFYLFGMDKTELGVGCKILGLLTHYFWLTYMFSMSAYMVILVVSIGKPNQTLTAMSTKFHITGIFGTPLLFIALNISVSATVDKEFGYGKNLCYIDTPMMRAVTFGLPIALVVVGNFAMYVYIIRTIMSTDTSMLSIDRQYITVYMRLGILMGITWITGFVYEAWRNFVVGLIFIILNAGQGCLIMFSLVFRKAIFTRYKRLMGKSVDSDMATHTTVALSQTKTTYN